MALLSLAGDQEDRVALRYLVGVGSGDWRTSQWAKIRASSVAEGKSPWEIFSEMKAGTRPITGMKAVFDRFDVIQTRLAGFSGLTRKTHRELTREPLVVDKLQLNKHLPQPEGSRS
jgi:hypothetical protein